jgi:hypothetical protein
MARFLAWIGDLRQARRVFLIGLVIGAVLFYFRWAEVTRIREVQRNGIEAIATVEGATRTTRGSSESFTLKLKWRDARGVIQSDDGVVISNAFAREIARSGEIIRSTVRIKYLPDSMAIWWSLRSSVPVVLEDVAHPQWEGEQWSKDLLGWLGAGAAGVGALGFGVTFLLGRRRREGGTAA